MRHEDYIRWVDILPTALLELQNSFKEILDALPAELVFGTTLRLPGEWFEDVNADEWDPHIFLQKIW